MLGRFEGLRIAQAFGVLKRGVGSLGFRGNKQDKEVDILYTATNIPTKTLYYLHHCKQNGNGNPTSSKTS